MCDLRSIRYLLPNYHNLTYKVLVYAELSTTMISDVAKNFKRVCVTA